MPTTNQAYSFDLILEGVRDRLVEVLELDEQYVRRVASDQYRYTHEETLVAIRPLGPSPSVNAGGGRRARPVSRTIRVYINKRSSLDFVGDDAIVLAELFALENTILDALDDYWVMNSSGSEPMTLEPIHPTDSANGPPVRQPDNDIGEVYSLLNFEIVYLQVNNTPQP